MRGNSFGKLFTITTFGESHGDALGAVIDGVPAGLEFNLDDLQAHMQRRAPGTQDYTTSRSEEDKVQILSGVFENKTLGTPISAIVFNTNQKSSDYNKLKDHYRPGHADKTTLQKFGRRDHRGGGRASGRETLSRVIGGYFAGLIMPALKFKVAITQIGPFKSETTNITQVSDFGFIDPKRESEIIDFLMNCKKEGQSCGGAVKVQIENVPPGLGEPVFDKLKAELSHAMLSIGSCMGITFGAGTQFASKLGTEVSQDSKNFGGIEGGISNAEPIEFDLYFKAPSTIGEKARQGRHDPCILPRVLVVIESMAKIVLADHYLRQNAYQNLP